MCTKKAPLSLTIVKPSVNNGFHTQSSKKLQLETLDIDSRLKKNTGKVGSYSSFVGKRL